MAEPIAPTPVLEGKDADEFVEKLLKPSTNEDIKFMEEIKELFQNHDPLIKDDL